MAKLAHLMTKQLLFNKLLLCFDLIWCIVLLSRVVCVPSIKTNFGYNCMIDIKGCTLVVIKCDLKLYFTHQFTFFLVPASIISSTGSSKLTLVNVNTNSFYNMKKESGFTDRTQVS